MEHLKILLSKIRLWLKNTQANRRIAIESRAVFANKISQIEKQQYISSQDVIDIEQILERHKISQWQKNGLGIPAYRRTLKALISNGFLNNSNIYNLERFKEVLKIKPIYLQNESKIVEKQRTVNLISSGNLPLVSTNLLLKKDETAYFYEIADLLEERVIGRQYVGGSSGVSFRVAKGVSFRVGASRGRSVSERGTVITDNGSLTITNKRIVFVGANKTITIKLENLAHYSMHGEILSFSDRGKNKTFQLLNCDQDITKAKIDTIVRRFQG
ncbi:hypothetical protein HG532_00765 [Moraxella osloensis]|nr:hypothetical protein [Moraxella osloensis]MBW4008562.1 hypothetical protein [Moraxella osloensis]